MKEYYQKPIKKNNAFLTVLGIAILFLAVVLVFVFVENTYNVYTDWKGKIEYFDIDTHKDYTSLYLNGNIKNISDQYIRRVDITFKFYKNGSNDENKSVEITKQVYYLSAGEAKYFNFPLSNDEQSKIEELSDYKIKVTGITYRK